KPFVQEVCLFCPNCIFPRENGTYLRGREELGDVVVKTLLTRDRLQCLIDGVNRTAYLPGEMAELGVYKGGSAAVIAGACPDKMLHLLDSFRGIAGTCSMGGHRAGDFGNTSVEEVRVNLAHHKNSIYHVGFFPDTTYEVQDWIRYSFVH